MATILVAVEAVVNGRARRDHMTLFVVVHGHHCSLESQSRLSEIRMRPTLHPIVDGGAFGHLFGPRSPFLDRSTTDIAQRLHVLTTRRMCKSSRVELIHDQHL
jgi:hypothetical protein